MFNMEMTKLMNSRTRIRARIDLCSFCPRTTPSRGVFWPPFPHRSSVCRSLCLLLLFCSPCPLLWPHSACLLDDQVHFIFHFPIWVIEAQLASSSTLSCGSHHPCLKKSLLLHISHLAWHQSWKRLPMTVWTFSVCEWCHGTNDFISV